MDSSSSSEHGRNNNAFEDIVPSNACVQSPDYPVYDVFINHRGPDVKTGLAALIKRQLAFYNLRVFLDQNELWPGDSIPAKIQHAIDTSTVHVAIFSSTYAHSQWCLAELSYMLTTSAKILPIFYNVVPSNLHYSDKGPYKDAFPKHQERYKDKPETVQKWKEDLSKVSCISGIVFNTSVNSREYDEAMLLERIVNRVVEETKGEVLDVATNPIGLDEAFEAFQNTISNSKDQYTSGYAKLVGIVGMGGVGKTTLAKKVYNEKSLSYKGHCCFLSDVRLEEKKSGLTSLQGKLLQKLLHYDWKIDSESHGKEIMRKQLQNQKVLLVLDDVDEVDQIDALLVKDVLGPESLVIVTSRDRGVLLSSGVVIFHEVKELRESHARQLFFRHAFPPPPPPSQLKEFEALVKKFLSACSGLPLSLKVIGALLKGKNLCYWKGTIEKMGKHILPKDIVKTLKVSFEALDMEEKEIFLDIACFFAGEEKNMLIKIWDGSGWSSMQSLENLEQKCLIELVHQNQGYENRGEKNCVWIRMHDHLRDMGRSVIDQQRQPSRLWRPEDISDYLLRIQHKMVTEVRGICGSPAPSFSPTWRRQSTRKDRWMRVLEICGDTRGPWSSSSGVAERALKLLQAEGDSVITEFNYSLRHLIWLRWYGCDANALYQLCAPNLRVLELFDFDCDLNTLWQNHNQVPTQLRELYVRNRDSYFQGLQKYYFMELPKSIRFLTNLERIVILRNDMTTLPDELCQLPFLNHLELRECRKLKSLPSDIGKLTNLRHLVLSCCYNLEALPNSFSQLIQLQYLSLVFCSRIMVPTDILRNITTLEYIDFVFSQEMLPIHITNQKLLRNLYVDCPLLKELPVDIDDLCNLRVLKVESRTMTALPSSLMGLSSLKSLDLFGCRRLQCLSESIGQLQALEYLNLSLTAIQVLPQGVEHLRNLVELKAYCCPLRDIMLSNPRDEERPWYLGNPRPEDSLAKAMIRLQSIKLNETEITKLCIATDVCPNLEILELGLCKCLIQVEALPITLVNLQLNGCEKLEKIQGLQKLTRLRYFNISRCHELQELEDLSELRSLERLTADGCWKLTKMEGLQQLQHLEDVQIAACTAGVWKWIECLKELPSKLCNVTLNMQTVGAEETQLYQILNSLGSSISMHDLQFGATCELELSEVRSCSGLFIIVLYESGHEHNYESGHERDDHNLILRNKKSEGKTERVSITVKSKYQWIILSMLTERSMFLRELEQIEMNIFNKHAMCFSNSNFGMRFNKNKAWAVLLKDEEECKMTEIWEKLFSYTYHNRAFKQ